MWILVAATPPLSEHELPQNNPLREQIVDSADSADVKHCLFTMYYVKADVPLPVAVCLYCRLIVIAINGDSVAARRISSTCVLISSTRIVQ